MKEKEQNEMLGISDVTLEENDDDHDDDDDVGI